MLYNKKRPSYPPNAVLIDRTTPYGNPYYLTPERSRLQCIALFEKNTLPTLDVEPLRGLPLLCHCFPKPCHGTSILRKLRLTRHTR